MIVRTATLPVAADMVAAVGGDGPSRLILRAVALPWNTPARVTDDGQAFYTETWEPGSLVADDGVMGVYAGHVPSPTGPQRGPLIGRVEVLGQAHAGAVLELVLADTPRAREVHALADTVGASVSIEADTGDGPPVRHGATVVRTAKQPARLTGVAVLTLPERGAFPAAVVTATRTSPEPERPTMTDTPTPEPEPTTPEPTTPEPTQVSRAEVNELIRAASARAFIPGRQEAHPLAIYPTLVAYADAVYADATIARVLADQLIADNPGVTPPAWITDIKGVMSASRPAVDATGGAGSIPPGGMEVDWPAFRGDLMTLVAEQLVEKTQIQSVKVNLVRESTDLRTWAGGSDISYQLIRRSSPSYREAYLRIMHAAYAAVTERDFELALIAGGTGEVILAPGATVDQFRAAVFQASVQVNAATGSPASVVLLSDDLFVQYGSALLPSQYGTQNVSGTADAATLNVNVSGLRIVDAGFLADGTMVVTNGSAAKLLEDGPFEISAPDVARLGENVAVWGMGAAAIFTPAGVVISAAA